jgi:hypothetical protein
VRTNDEVCKDTAFALIVLLRAALGIALKGASRQSPDLLA